MPIELPASVDDVLDENATFEPGALAAVREFARSKPWRGSDAERLIKFNACAAELARVYSFEPWTVQLGEHPDIEREGRRLIFKRLSVVTFLHAMAAARGCNTFGCFRWSINIFRRCFPASFAACRRAGPFLVHAE